VLVRGRPDPASATGIPRTDPSVARRPPPRRHRPRAPAL